MKNLIVVSVLTLFLGLTSCSKDDSPAEEASLVGKWEFYKLEIEGVSVDYQHDACGNDYYQFNVNLEGDEVSYYSVDRSCENDTNSFTYTVSEDDVISMAFSRYNSQFEIVSLTQTELKVNAEEDEVYVFRRVN